MSLSPLSLLIVLLVWIAQPVRNEPVGESVFIDTVQPILRQHCSHCHDKAAFAANESQP